ncbi:MAG: glycosyltransferase [Candidatus Zixiibacteriota bacterium]
MRIAIYIGQLDVGGAEGQIIVLAEGLLARGHDVRLITDEGRTAAVPEKLKPYLVTVPARPRLARLRALVRTLRSFDPAVLHCQLSSANLWGTIAGRRARVPVVVTSFLSTDLWKKRYHLLLDRLVTACSAGVFVNSAGVAERYRRVLGRSNRKVRIIYNGVDTARFDANAKTTEHGAARRRELGIPADAPVIINVANLFAVKNQPMLLGAVAACHRGVPENRRPYVLLAGEGPMRPTLEEEAGRLGITPFVRFLGQVRDVASYLAAADIFVLSSHSEGFSNALLEAMASSLACVATDVGGNAEALTEETGIIVPPGGEEALAAALAKLVVDGYRRREMGAAARRRAVTTFGLDRMIDATACWYLGRLVYSRGAEGLRRWYGEIVPAQ